MIILNLKDGLGNQFFEMAFARKLQKMYPGEKIYINDFFFQNGKRRFSSLQHFAVSEDITFMKKPKTLLFTALFMMRIALCHPKVFFKWMTSNERPNTPEIFAKMNKNGLYLTFNTFGYMPVIRTKRKIKYIYGNFEHYKFFEDIIDELKSDFASCEKMPDKNEKMLSMIKNTESVCVHIRRGDYLDPRWAMLNVCTLDYYRNGMEHVYQQRRDAKFFVFSNTHDDIEWIKANYEFDPKYDIEYVDLGNSDYEEFELIRNCKHFIISNSTFSWWGACLSDCENKIVVLPEKWTTTVGEDCSGFYLPGWHSANI